MASDVEARIRRIETIANEALRAPCSMRRQLHARAEHEYQELTDRIYEIRDAATARRMAGRSARAVDLIDNAQRSIEQHCAGLRGTAKRKRRRK